MNIIEAQVIAVGFGMTLERWASRSFQIILILHWLILMSFSSQILCDQITFNTCPTASHLEAPPCAYIYPPELHQVHIHDKFLPTLHT